MNKKKFLFNGPHHSTLGFRPDFRKQHRIPKNGSFTTELKTRWPLETIEKRLSISSSWIQSRPRFAPCSQDFSWAQKNDLEFLSTVLFPERWLCWTPEPLKKMTSFVYFELINTNLDSDWLHRVSIYCWPKKNSVKCWKQSFAAELTTLPIVHSYYIYIRTEWHLDHGFRWNLRFP